MKTIGILTYHHYYNYGTMLQALALQQYIYALGYRAEIIDYQHDTSVSFQKRIALRIKRFPIYFMEYDRYRTLAKNVNYQKERKELFERFYAQNLIVGKRKYTCIEDLRRVKPDYDGYVIGSDQTWNPFVSNRPEAFYLTFLDDDHKKGSYAPSLPVIDMTEEQRAYLKKHLSRFAYVSCREATGAKELETILNRKVPCVIDPTLLINQSQWEQYEDQHDLENFGDYILVYFLGDNKKHRELVRHIQHKTGFQVVTIPMSYLEMKDSDWVKVTVGPDGFLKLIHNAKMVCTDSFHGTMFSINYQKQFYSFCKMKDGEWASNNSRLYDSLALFSLEDRIIKDKTDFDCAGKINYEDVGKRLVSEREKATDYLRTMLSDITV